MLIFENKTELCQIFLRVDWPHCSKMFYKTTLPPNAALIVFETVSQITKLINVAKFIADHTKSIIEYILFSAVAASRRYKITIEKNN